ncbi:MAG: hypothetical protein U0487_00160 [Patescibacteria group bacterium]
MQKRHIVPLLLLVAVAASVASAPASEAAIFRSKGIKITRLKKAQAFGTLSSANGGTANNATISARPMAMGGGMAVSAVAPATEGAVVDSKMMMPYPGDNGDYTQLDVDYNWATEIPAIAGAADVYRAVRTKPDASITKTLLKSAGLPAALADGISEVQSLNASWKGKGGMVWSFDAMSNSLSWWKEVAYPQNYEGQPKLDKDRAIKVAQDFVKANGLTGYATTAPELEDAPWIRPLMEGTSMPCAAVKAEPAGFAGDLPVNDMVATSDRAIVAPCFWYPRTVNIVYPDKRDGKRVTDAWSGYPQQVLTITVSLDTYEVTGGYANLPTSLEASSYPMIDKGAVEEALKKGGRSPYYGWGKKGTRVQVQYNTFEQVVMRYDSWKDNKNETYFVPALLATGKVDSGDGNGLQDYRTIVPLIKAEFLEEMPTPIMYMKGETTDAAGTVGGTATLNVVAPAPAPVPVPVK